MKKRFEIVQVKPSIGLGGTRGTYEITFKVFQTREMADLRTFYVQAEGELDAYNEAKILITRQLKG